MQDKKEKLPQIERCVCGAEAKIHVAEEGFYMRCTRDPGLTSARRYRTVRMAITKWNERQVQMDNTDVTAVRAYHSGMSYGNYVARVPVEPPAERYPKKTEGAKIPELRCVCCGMLIPPGGHKRRYCSPVCADRFRLEQKRLHYLKAQAEEELEERPKCLECGKPIPKASNRRKYCSATCADIAADRNRAEAKRRKRRSGTL